MLFSPQIQMSCTSINVSRCSIETGTTKISFMWRKPYKQHCYLCIYRSYMAYLVLIKLVQDRLPRRDVVFLGMPHLPLFSPFLVQFASLTPLSVTLNLKHFFFFQQDAELHYTRKWLCQVLKTFKTHWIFFLHLMLFRMQHSLEPQLPGPHCALRSLPLLTSIIP